MRDASDVGQDAWSAVEYDGPAKGARVIHRDRAEVLRWAAEQLHDVPYSMRGDIEHVKMLQALRRMADELDPEER